ncbi:hypothetical protein AAW51_2736 [Caldimonas brevitalea]|uniref:Secreted protein n=1 Tax=Caldimonas brevitalea TaxID=413882 RepID=A0A0G3BJ77_9BURK|nr:hypothetical protein AAW51_2736 [Caldimonas brevitalea]
MRRLVRSVLLWVLALALPIQGAVAATVLAYGPHHHGPRIVASQPTPPAHGLDGAGQGQDHRLHEFEPHIAHDSRYPSDESRAGVFLPDGPERPPRNHLT